MFTFFFLRISTNVIRDKIWDERENGKIFLKCLNIQLFSYQLVEFGYIDRSET